MDELTIGDKIYVSSKKAAKITGYAKDYVGQLCREGRVEARLVGRNWYVLESSLMEHRFGADAEAQPEKREKDVPEPLSDVESEATEVTSSEPEEVEWEAPVYSREEPVLVPLAPKEPATQESQQVVSDMQTAWQEWFTTQKRVQESVPESLETVEPEAAIVPSEEEYPVLITHIEAPEALPESFQPEETVPLTIHREEATTHESSVTQGDLIDLTQPRVVVEKQIEDRAVHGGGRALQAIFIVVAGIAFCVALIGTGAIGILVKSAGVTPGPQKALIEYLGGESSYKSISK